ncbi:MULTISPECIES: hypothetical protein [unclassified Cupriavidus]|uniref:hypothetical protein n=1 Tax=unclassified Cupriavidus TaxID=2640874 RepID=UPI001C006BFB|nr:MULTISPECIES: hypothetical protein [unclassified Cupriavidus]MCA3184304.1 hypothetical protein [Cupriavidus sp.]MCA3190970.1 hypothetical protein [Cupriavidus sp.]MCA3199314.1 hypothetical protein [Cupriavidus sp.]MCA3204581.1 hypothetical protein [Cupriavidus sp.]MCA3209050.1 hypothetical protein [Cupriavidus sp.]
MLKHSAPAAATGSKARASNKHAAKMRELRAAMLAETEHAQHATLDGAIKAFEVHTARAALLRSFSPADLLAVRDTLEARAEADWSVWSDADRGATVREYDRVTLALSKHFLPPVDADGWPLPTDARPGILSDEHRLWTTGHGIERERRQRLYNAPNPLRLSMPQ